MRYRWKYGLWCIGCDLLYEKYEVEELEPDVLARVVPQGGNANQFMMRMQYRAWSRVDFIRHAKQSHHTSHDTPYINGA